MVTPARPSGAALRESRLHTRVGSSVSSPFHAEAELDESAAHYAQREDEAERDQNDGEYQWQDQHSQNTNGAITDCR